jgi:PAS domain S-box-containing protein
LIRIHAMKLPRSANLLAFGIVALLAATLAFQGWMVRESRQSALDQAALRAANRAQATANQVEAVFAQVDVLLLSVSDHLEASDLQAGLGAAAAGRRDRLRELLRQQVARVPMVGRLSVIGPDGRCLHSSGAPTAEPELAGRIRLDTQEPGGSDRLWISEPYRDPANGSWGIDLARRLTDPHGRFLGLVQAKLDVGALATVMEAVDQQQWILALYHDDRRLVARSPALPAARAQVPPDIRLPGEGGPSLTAFQSPGFGERETHLWAMEHLDGAPMFAVAGFSRQRALAGWKHDLRIHLAASALLVAGCVGILALLRRYLGAVQALHSREAYFRTLFDASPEAVAVLEGEATVDANRRYRELFRVGPGESAAPWELAPETQPDGSRSRERGRRLAAPPEGGPAYFQWLCRRTDGSDFEAEIRITRFRLSERELRIAVVRDLTEIRALEARLHQAQKLDALGQLAGGVAHDFNNMLAAIHGSAELLSERCADDGMRRTAGLITAAAERASQLTRQLLAFARQGKILSTPTDFHQTLRDAGTLLERTLDRRIRLEWRLQAETAMVIGDPAQLENVIINLALNARDAMPEGGELCFATEWTVLDPAHGRLGPFKLEPGTYLHVSVRDSGPGIPPEHLHRIFDPFFTTKEPGKGTGLGLASVFGTLAAHHGAVTAENLPGGGAAFHLYLPLAGDAAPAAAAPAPAPGQGSGTVLVIDDEELVRAATVMQLQSLGYRTLAADGPEAGIAAFRSEHAGLAAVLVDMVMPQASGAEVAYALRGIDETVPVVIVSGFPANAKVDELLARGLAGYLQKPFSRQDLGRMLERVRMGAAAR